MTLWLQVMQPLANVHETKWTPHVKRESDVAVTVCTRDCLKTISYFYLAYSLPMQHLASVSDNDGSFQLTSLPGQLPQRLGADGASQLPGHMKEVGYSMGPGSGEFHG